MWEATAISITLSWKPGFNGGLPQSFAITYNAEGEAEKTVNGISDSGEDRMQYKLKGDYITHGTKYFASIVAVNRVGPSDRVFWNDPDPIKTPGRPRSM